MQQGGSVIGATALMGKDYSVNVTLDDGQLSELRGKHGQLEQWWRERFGFGFECLTASEARYLGKIRVLLSPWHRHSRAGGNPAPARSITFAQNWIPAKSVRE